MDFVEDTISWFSDVAPNGSPELGAQIVDQMLRMGHGQGLSPLPPPPPLNAQTLIRELANLLLDDARDTLKGDCAATLDKLEAKKRSLKAMLAALEEERKSLIPVVDRILEIMRRLGLNRITN